MSVYDKLGVTPIINALGTFTRVSGSLMPSEVLAAQQEAARQFVCIEELQFAAGRFISKQTGAEAAYVTSGAQAALVLSVAACITGLDAEKMDRLPDCRGMPNEVVMARMQRNHYDHYVEAAGGCIVEAGDQHKCDHTDLQTAIGPNTIALLYLPWHEPEYNLVNVVKIAHDNNLPVIVDAAGALGEPENLSRFVSDGADLVCFSGGKYLRGPQASGFVCGKRELISAIAWQHLDMDFTPDVWTAPPELLDPQQLSHVPRQGIGRGYKASKEQIVGLVTALELFLNRDHQQEKADCLKQLQEICDQLADVPGITAEIKPADSLLNCYPEARITIDEQATGLNGYDFIRKLKSGTPSIHPGERELKQNAVLIHPFGLQDGEEQAIVKRIREILSDTKTNGD